MPVIEISVRQERLRKSFRPACVRVLFIGESPPASGRFFYQGDSGLFRAMREAFQRIDPSISTEMFIPFFKESGCYLIDLCAVPVDRMDPKSRRVYRRDGEASLARIISRFQPPVIATVMRAIEGHVTRAAANTKWQGKLIHLPYPGRWSRHRKAFLEALAPTIRELLSTGKNV